MTNLRICFGVVLPTNTEDYLLREQSYLLNKVTEKVVMESTGGDETEALIVPSSCSKLQPDAADVTDYQSTNNNDKKDGAPLTLDEAVEMIGFGRFQIWMLMVFGWCRLADALGNLAPSYIMPKVSCEFEASDLELSLFPSTGLAGILVGSFVWGSIADIKGRIPVLVLCEIINTLFAIGASTSQSLWFLTVMRFFWGVGLGGSVCVTSTYVIEFLPIKNRGRYMLTLPGSFSMGLLLIAGLAWLIIPHEEWTWYIQGYTFNSWRLFLLVTAVPAIVSIPLLLTLPESPRYLVQVNKIRKAKTILQYVYKKNKKIPLSQVNFDLQRVAASNSTRRELKKFSNITKNILSIITTPEMRTRFVVSSIICPVWLSVILA
ncbi:hypothetical protein EB796_022341 [Bugula neritina]|uniref:Major facilitator superfamily (MFS) profile domain-containing protein n=1 Tax=Bugula neritina TaxID=10212 RepID=A0A7J7J141_BUGNE|nr:hypothetical protein EB796_022341 [Bugula neritina]